MSDQRLLLNHKSTLNVVYFLILDFKYIFPKN